MTCKHSSAYEYMLYNSIYRRLHIDIDMYTINYMCLLTRILEFIHILYRNTTYTNIHGRKQEVANLPHAQTTCVKYHRH